MARGLWHTEWLYAGEDAEKKKNYTLTGTFCNLEPDATDTDRWALAHGYVAITPTTLDNTAYGLIDVLSGVL